MPDLPSDRDGPAPPPASGALAVGDVLENLLSRHPWAGVLRAATVFRRWPRLVGSTVAAHTRPLSIRDGVLLVAARHPVWAAQLAMLRTDLLRRIRSECANAVIDITFDPRWDPLYDRWYEPAVACASGTEPPDPKPPPADVMGAFENWRLAAHRRRQRLSPQDPSPRI
jgi:hypothetical protein